MGLLLSRRKFLMLAAGVVAVPAGVVSSIAFEVTHGTIAADGLPDSFAGLKICHLTDLHSHEFGSDQRDVVALIRSGAPDIIVMTGDMVNRGETEERAFLTLCAQLPAIAPTYYVTGNHEWSGLHDGIADRVVRCGVQVMDNRHVALKRGAESVYLAGAGEWLTYGLHGVKQATQDIPDDGFVLLLAHHPEPIHAYAAAGANVVLAGHTHGGQIRIPFLGSPIIPDQGFFPKYTSGLFHVGRTAMYISRGMGSHLPLRINCPHELAFLTLQ